MSWIFFILGILQALFLYYLSRVGLKLVDRAQKDHELARYTPPGGWPLCALIIPVSGNRPEMGSALASMLEQNYPNYGVYFVVADKSDPAWELAAALARSTPHARIVEAGRAGACGQKNFNLLKGVAAAGPTPAVYAFCDSTHIAQPDFLRCLVEPIARGEAAFATGYHQVQPKDTGVITVAYALTALFMRFLQGVPGLAQLWGGAMAMSREAFFHYHVAELWAHNVVDDCSLSARLASLGAHIRLCPAALLITPAAGHSFGAWHAWLKRQILYLKFCMPGQWLLLGLVSLFMLLPPVWAILAMLGGLTGAASGTEPFLALCWLCFLGWILMGWRRFFTLPIPVSHWLWAFFCAVFMFAASFFQTIPASSITWSSVRYEVGRGGQVKNISRE